MNTFTVVFLIAMVISYAVQFWLSMRQKSFVISHRDAVPDAFKQSVSLEAHQKAADYTVEKGKIGDLDSVISIVLLLILTLGGGISLSFSFWSSFDLSPMLTDLCAVITIFMIMTMLEIPMSLYQTFVIEEKYGFNKSTKAQFYKDQGISLALTLAIGMPIMALILGLWTVLVTYGGFMHGLF